MMTGHPMHSIYRVQNVEIVADYTLQVSFDDGTQQVIDFRPLQVDCLARQVEKWQPAPALD